MTSPCWRDDTKTTMDEAGRVVIPAAVRRRAGLIAGMELEVEVDDEDSVRLVRTVSGPRLVRRAGRLLVRATIPAKRLPDVDAAALAEEERSRRP